jgi:hypothetical protein
VCNVVVVIEVPVQERREKMRCGGCRNLNCCGDQEDGGTFNTNYLLFVCVSVCVTVVFEWRYSGVAEVLQWYYTGVTMVVVVEILIAVGISSTEARSIRIIS